jgi:polyhydroxyalkanoate synthesis regulator protein
MRSIRRFKKYANRKFYDVDRGVYAAVSEIAAVVKRGGNVVMVCDRTGRDLTAEILVRILYEEVRRVGKSCSGKPGEQFKGVSGELSAEVSRLIRTF